MADDGRLLRDGARHEARHQAWPIEAALLGAPQGFDDLLARTSVWSVLRVVWRKERRADRRS